MDLEVKVNKKILLSATLLCALPMQANYFSGISKWFACAAVKRVKKSWYKKDTKNTQTLFKQNNINNIGSNLFAKNGFQLNSGGSIFSGMPNQQKKTITFNSLLPKTKYQKMVNALIGKQQSNGNDSSQNNRYNGFNAKTAFTIGAFGATAGYFLTKNDEDEQKHVNALSIFGYRFFEMPREYKDRSLMKRELFRASNQKKASIIKYVSDNLMQFLIDDKCFEVLKHEILYSCMWKKSLLNPLIDTIEQNFSKVLFSKHGLALLNEIIDRPYAQKKLCSALSDNLEYLFDAQGGTRLIDMCFIQSTRDGQQFVNKESDVCRRLCRLIKENVRVCLSSFHGMHLIEALVQCDKESAEFVLNFFIQNGGINKDPLRLYSVLRSALKNYPGLADLILRLIRSELGSFIGYDKDFMKILIKNVSSIQLLIDATVASLEGLVCDSWQRDEERWDFLRQVVERASASDQLFLFIDKMSAHFDVLAKTPIGRKVIKLIIEKESSASCLQKIEELSVGHACAKLIPYIFKAKYSKSTSQTAAHFIACFEQNKRKLINWLPKDSTALKRIVQVIEDVIHLEELERAKNRYTFVHVCPWRHRFLQDVFSDLWKVVHGADFDNYKFVRFITSINGSSGKQHEKKRQYLVKNGSRAAYYDTNLGKYMLFMNCGLFVNRYSSNSFYYMIKRAVGCNRTVFSLKLLLKHLGIDISPYVDDLKSLEQLHEEANLDMAGGFVVSVPPEMLEKLIYVSHPRGIKKQMEIEGFGKTDDVQLILDTMCTSPQKIVGLDRMEFVFALTKDCALNPEVVKSGAIKIIPFNPADPEKLAQYKKALAVFIAKVKRDLQQEREVMTNREFEEQQNDLRYFESLCNEHNCLNDDDCPSRLVEA